MQTAKRMLAEGRADEALDRVLNLARDVTSASELSSLVRLREKLGPNRSSTTPVKIALLGTGTTKLIKPAL